MSQGPSGVVERGGRARLALEALERLRVLRHLGPRRNLSATWRPSFDWIR